MNIYQRFDDAFRRAGDAPALLCPDGDDWRYADLRGAVGRMATALKTLGVAPDDRVLVQVEKTPQAVALYLACLKIGAIYAPINTAYTAAEVAYFLADSDPALFVAAAPFAIAVQTATLDANGGGSSSNAGGRILPARGNRAARGRPHRGHRLHLRHHWPLQGGDAQPRELDVQR